MTDCDKELQIVTKEDKTLRRQALHRLLTCDNPLLERDKSMTQRYKVLHREERLMRVDGIDMSTVGVELPLGLSRKTKLFHRAIVTVGGVTGTGKTMFALNFIRANMDKHEIYYLNTEMSEQELKAKKDAFLNVPYNSWRFTAIEVVGEVASSIRTNTINIIDYLQAPPEKPYLIRDSLDAIKAKLGTGMALVLIQRKSGNPWGEGGQYSAHNASLYVNLDWQSLEVMKNRFREADDFRGKDKRNYTIEHGMMKPLSGWYSADKPPTKTTRGHDPDFPREEDIPI